MGIEARVGMPNTEFAAKSSGPSKAPGAAAPEDIHSAGLTAQIAVIGPDGFSVASTASAQRVSVADREHFIAQRDSAEDTLFISKPVLGRSSGRWSIQLTRKILSATGSFAGVVSVYQHHDFAPEKREAVEAWGEHVAGLAPLPDNVIALRG